LISGNKWRKLQAYIARAKQEKLSRIVTCGGPFSNHIIAAAAACKDAGLLCTGLIRGYQQPGNAYRIIAGRLGMQSVYMDAAAFEQRKDWYKQHGDLNKSMYIESGGEGEAGELGCDTFWDELPFIPDRILLATATGTTMRGLLRGRDRRGLSTHITGVPVLLNATEQMNKLAEMNTSHYKLEAGYEWGGYARCNMELMRFIIQETHALNIIFDPVYTAKAWWAANQMLDANRFNAGEKVLFVHTGGTLGLFSERYTKMLMAF
jgi:1-aminocyclopropane-1-carboxylate deaminase